MKRALRTGFLTLRIIGVVVVVSASLAAVADQSDRLVSAQEILGVHEIPSFVTDRVELTPGLSANGSAKEADATPRDGIVWGDAPERERTGDG